LLDVDRTTLGTFDGKLVTASSPTEFVLTDQPLSDRFCTRHADTGPTETVARARLSHG
jgi:hypothetical protein